MMWRDSARDSLTGIAVLPPQAPLDMPTRSFSENPPRQRRPDTGPRDIWIRRAILIVGTAIVTLLAGGTMAAGAGQNGLNPTEIALLALFLPLFAWIAFSFCSALAGFVVLLAQGRASGFVLPPSKGVRLNGRTAILMPIHNEDVAAVMGRVERMALALGATPQAAAFDFFILSDTTERLIARAEETAWTRAAPLSPIPLYYRRRPQNIGRKPGNIADWITRFGGAYDHMLVLDADSLMSAEVMIRMAAAMEANPGVALIQTIPVVAGCRTLFARWQQFAARLYGPVASAGLMWWSGSEASFWGHNAIARVAAFADACGLPRLSGREPLGGVILSHDMVEAAMLRRRGWAVHMVDPGDGSFEEFPPTPLDHAIRDRRWCQGNLQHVRLLWAKGFHAVSRLHLLMGASAYLTSPLWLMLLVATVLRHDDAGEFGIWFPPVDMTWVWALTLTLLLGPKAMGVVWALISRERRARFGGAQRIVASVVIEVPLAILMAPMVMITQTLMLIDIVRGRSAKWSAQRRDLDRLMLGEALRFYRMHMLTGAALLSGALLTGEGIEWITPVAAGLLLAPVLAAFTSRRDLGAAFAREGLFLTPEELGADGRVRVERRVLRSVSAQ